MVLNMFEPYLTACLAIKQMASTNGGGQKLEDNEDIELEGQLSAASGFAASPVFSSTPR